MSVNEQVIYNALPETFTHWNNCNLKVRYYMKLAGYEYSNDEELSAHLSELSKKGMILHDGNCIKRNPNYQV